jgi:hypothetical protein
MIDRIRRTDLRAQDALRPSARVEPVRELPSSGVEEAPTLGFTGLAQQLRGLKLGGIRGQLEEARALNGLAVVVGPRANAVARSLDYLNARSRTFRGWIERSRRKGRRFMVRTTGGDADSFASLPPQDGARTETVLLNLTQAMGTRHGIAGLVAHEFGHAAGGLKDGAVGQVGPNQRAEALVLAEAGLGDGSVYRYGELPGRRQVRAVGRILLA